ncbi:MAG TPA: MliC family protein [Zeimonas sp.]
MRSTRSQIARFASLAIAAPLASFHLSASAADPADPTSFNPHNFKFPVGVYRCELNRSVDVRQVSPDMQSAVLSFDKKEYRLKAVHARSGALRYEDDKSGLVWLIIAGKSMLLDMKHGRQLANECRT